MSRKHSISALLDESPRKESKKKIPCNCDKCNGSLVDARTEFSHRYRKSKKKVKKKKEFIFRSRTRNIRQNQIMSLGDQKSLIQDHDDIFNADILDANILDADILDADILDADIFNNDITKDNSITFDKLNDLFEDYLASGFLDSESPEPNKFIDTDDRFTWILLWIMNFRIKFNLSNNAIEAFLKFMKLVLIKISGDKFESFCGSLYTTKNFLGLLDQFVSFVACQKCHKLYKQDKVINFQQN